MNIPAIINKFIKILLLVLIVLISISLIIGAFDLVYMMITDLKKPPLALLNIKDLKEIFALSGGYFLLKKESIKKKQQPK